MTMTIRLKLLSAAGVFTACGISFILGIMATRWLPLGTRHLGSGQYAGKPAEINPSRFTVVAFPASDNAIRQIDRAVLLSLSELEESLVDIFIDGKPQKFGVDEFSLLPPSAEVEQRHHDRLNDTLEQWGEDTDWDIARTFINRKGFDGEVVVRLTLHHKKGRFYEFLYRLPTNGGAHPVWKVIF